MSDDIVEWVRPTLSRRIKIDFWPPPEAVDSQIRGAVQAHDADPFVSVVTADNQTNMPAHFAVHDPRYVAALRLSPMKALGGTPARIERVAD
jgi:hypothetical protein